MVTGGPISGTTGTEIRTTDGRIQKTCEQELNRPTIRKMRSKKNVHLSRQTVSVTYMCSIVCDSAIATLQELRHRLVFENCLLPQHHTDIPIFQNRTEYFQKRIDTLHVDFELNVYTMSIQPSDNGLICSIDLSLGHRTRYLHKMDFSFLNRSPFISFTPKSVVHSTHLFYNMRTSISFVCLFEWILCPLLTSKHKKLKILISSLISETQYEPFIRHHWNEKMLIFEYLTTWQHKKLKFLIFLKLFEALNFSIVHHRVSANCLK